MIETQTVPPRSQTPREFTWNAESVFASPQDWENEARAIQADLPALTAFQGRLAEGPETLAQALQTRDDLFRRMVVVMMYANMSHEVDKTDQDAALRAGKARSLFGQVLSAAAFVEPEIIAAGQETVSTWLQQAPRLVTYTHYLDDLFRKQAHVRSAEVEELLGMLADPFSGPDQTYGMLVDADFVFAPASDEQGEQAPVSQGNFYKLLASPDRELRRTTYESYTDQYVAHKNSLTSNLVASIKQNVFRMRARKHNSTLEASLFENNVPVEVFYNLLDTFQKNLPTWQRYFEVRRKALGVERLEPYDLWAPLTGERPKVPFPQAVEWVCAGLSPLGEEYTRTIRRGCLEQRWVDVYPNQGKFSGAFSYGAPGTYPFICMSYTDEIFSLSTLAHELGHSMHSYLTWETQPFISSDYSLFVAEVASNFHQAMVRAHLLQTNPERSFQIGLIEEAMANFYRYFLTMPTLARFELETHQRIERGDGLNADQAIELMATLFQEAFGAAVHVDTQRVGMWWATFGHLYADYYVYQYATGISAAHALSNRILSGTPGAAQNYLSFLKAGGSLYPLDALKLAGVDMTTPAAVEETFAVMASYVDKLEQFFQ